MEEEEDIDPPAGPITDLMAEYQLSSTKIVQSPSPPKTDQIRKLNEEFFYSNYFYSLINIRALFQDLFGYILDIRWYHYMKKNVLDDENEIVLREYPWSSFRHLMFFFLIYLTITFSWFPFFAHSLIIIYLLFLLINDLLIPLYIYHLWFKSLISIRIFFQTIQIQQHWLTHHHGFQLIRPISSSSFENYLYHLRRKIFQQLQEHFIRARHIACRYAHANLASVHLLCQIDIDEFGPLVDMNTTNLDTLTNRFDHASLRSLGQLCRLQVNESIELIHSHRPNSIVLFRNYNLFLRQSIEQINRARRQCSSVDYVENFITKSSSSSKFISRLTSSCFLLRSNCEQLFEINRSEQINDEQLQRIIHDLKTVVCSLEAIRNKNSVSSHLLNNADGDLPSIVDTISSPISSFHRFDDQLDEIVDEILVCETGTKNDEEDLGSALQMEDYDKRFLREQTNCLLMELRSAIAGKKQEWQEREQRLLGPVAMSEEPPMVTSEREEQEESFEKVPLPPSSAVSMLDELKHTFALNRKKLNISEDIFGEVDDDEENFDDNQDTE